MNVEEFYCNSCGASGVVDHHEEDNISFCPFCSESLYDDATEGEYYPEEEYEEDTDDYQAPEDTLSYGRNVRNAYRSSSGDGTDGYY